MLHRQHWRDVGLQVPLGGQCGLDLGAQRVGSFRVGSGQLPAEMIGGNAKYRVEHVAGGLLGAEVGVFFLSLFDQLENGEWKDKIDGEVIEALEAEGISIIPDWREHSTLHRAAQGV